jgi:hypothetical protein
MCCMSLTAGSFTAEQQLLYADLFCWPENQPVRGVNICMQLQESVSSSKNQRKKELVGRGGTRLLPMRCWWGSQAGRRRTLHAVCRAVMPRGGCGLCVAAAAPGVLYELARCCLGSGGRSCYRT